MIPLPKQDPKGNTCFTVPAVGAIFPHPLLFASRVRLCKNIFSCTSSFVLIEMCGRYLRVTHIYNSFPDQIKKCLQILRCAYFLVSTMTHFCIFFLVFRFIPAFLHSVCLTRQTHAPTPFIHEHVAGASVIFVHPASTPPPSGSCALIFFWVDDSSPLQSTRLQF